MNVKSIQPFDVLFHAVVVVDRQKSGANRTAQCGNDHSHEEVIAYYCMNEI